MIVILCLDDNQGISFNRRRQSRDRVVIQEILRLGKERNIWIGPDSEKLFERESTHNLVADQDFLWKSKAGDYCFVENQGLASVEDRIEKIIVFWWNRKYPADCYLDIRLTEWKSVERKELVGYSHEKITREVYVR